MNEKISIATRSRMMAAVRQKHTKPERAVRSALFSAGFRYRLHRRDLPGSPDIVLPRRRTAIFVHGCFWHGHNCSRGRRPASNVDFWNAKLDRKLARERASRTALEAIGWSVEIVWECSIDSDIERLSVALATCAQTRRGLPPIKLTRYSAKKPASLGGPALPIMRATGSISPSG